MEVWSDSRRMMVNVTLVVLKQSHVALPEFDVVHHTLWYPTLGW
eukprot:COSAG02_NODE_448_length_22102_cov_11.767032_4_plen_44_part_00